MKIVRLVCCMSLLLVSLLAISPPGAVFAQEDELELPEEKIELKSLYPKLESIAGGDFEFEVEFKYTGVEDREFQLRTIKPQGWEVSITPPYEKEKKLSAINLPPAFGFANKLRVVATAPFYPLPEPGEYKITLEVVSGELSTTAEFTAVVTAKYSLIAVSSTERYNTTATAGEDTIFEIQVQNWSTAPVNNIKFSPTKPEGWVIEFTPDKIDLLDAFDEQVVNVSIQPPADTIAGDYDIRVRASGTQASTEEVKIRVTVETSTIWGWFGVGIILVVVAGLIVIFMRFSRR